MQDLIATTLLLLQSTAGDTHANSSALAATVIWMLVIAVVLVCLLAIGFAALGTRDRTRRRTDV